MGQAKQLVASDTIGAVPILAGLGVEIVMPLGSLTSVAGRLATLIMAGHCMAAAALWKHSESF